MLDYNCLVTYLFLILLEPLEAMNLNPVNAAEQTAVLLCNELVFNNGLV